LSVEWGLLGSNPLSSVKKMEEEGRERYLSSEEIGRLLSECKSPHLHIAVMIALNTGLRLTDVLTLEWRRDVDMEEKVVRKRIVKKKGPLKVVMIPMTAALHSALTDYKKQQKVMSKWVVPSPVKPSKCMSADSNFGFETACVRAGIDVIEREWTVKGVKKKFKGSSFRFHDLRHTFASHFAQRTGNLGALQEILGHSDPKMTKRYAHFCVDFKRKMMELFENNA
ncbi:MAG: site-specific integrase, partial [Salinivirgaceae bacterium]|nr:site-specific integrase [Salinivirgaceae bacterium]